jgi:hypothetical protein
MTFIIFSVILNRSMPCSKCVRNEHMVGYESEKPIYCLMVTGKDNIRYQFAKKSIMNFLIQTYKNKHLIIINHGDKQLVSMNNNLVTELMVHKANKTLGDLRNISLNHVPEKAIFTTWDDDDWRSSDYLQKLYNVLISNNAEMVMIRNRLEYNLNNNSVWKASLNSGFLTFFMFKDNRLRYSSQNTLEDQIIKTDAYKIGKRVIVYDNDPTIYVRYIHKNNTSPYVKKSKANPEIKGTDYYESEATIAERAYAATVTYNIVGTDFS